MMYMIYIIIGMLIGIILLLLVAAVFSTRRDKLSDLPPALAKNLSYMWKSHPNLLLNLEDILRSWNEMIEIQMKEDTAREERTESNRRYEGEHLNGVAMPEMMKVSMEGFAIKHLLEQRYPGERSLLMEACLQRVCNKIANRLEPEELDLIFQLDRNKCDEAFEILLQHDSDIISGLEEAQRILQNGRNQSDNPTQTPE